MVTEVTFSPVTQEDRGLIECVGYDLKGQSVGTVGSLNLKKVLGKSKFNRVPTQAFRLITQMYLSIGRLNPIALRMAKTLWSFGRSECYRVKTINFPFFPNGK